MRYGIVLSSIIMLVMCISCIQDIRSGGIVHVRAWYVRMIDSCTAEYKVRFSNDGQLSFNDGHYWVGLVRKFGRDEVDLLAYSESQYLEAPFSDIEMTVILRHVGLTYGDDIFGLAVKSSSPGDIDFQNKGISDYATHYPQFAENCCGIEIQVYSQGIPIEENSCVYISRLPIMPPLRVMTVQGTATGSLIWRLSISYNRSNRNDNDIFIDTLDAETDWYPIGLMNGKICGGQAKIICYSNDMQCASSFDFAIRAYNPDENTVIQFINSQPGALWYYKYVAKHEGGMQLGRYYLQFNEEWLESCDSTGIRYTPNASFDRGFGIYQLTWFDNPARIPNVHELWSWRQNVISGTRWLYIKYVGAIEYMNDERNEAFDYCSPCAVVPDINVGGVTFSDYSATTIEHAVAMKRYNGVSGAGNGEFCEWVNGLVRWQFNQLNSDGINYVHEVCTLYVSD